MNVKALIANAIYEARTKYPKGPDGTTWDQSFIAPETARVLADAILIAFNEAGLEITKKPS